MSARDEVLARIRTALGYPAPPPATEYPAAEHPATEHPATGPAAADAIPRGYRAAGALGQEELLGLLEGRLADYHAQVRRCRPGELAVTVAAALTARAARRIVIPPGLDLPGLDLPGTEFITDGGLSPAELDAVDGVITQAAVAVAESGTIVLDGSPGQGRRAITLIPDYHLCIIQAGQVVALAGEALARLTPARPLTWISGPSATSDIELDRVEGVHGPRTLEVILVASG